MRFAMLLPLVLLGCPPAPPAPMPPDASDASPAPPPVADSAPPAVADAAPPTSSCVAACNTMAALGCREGKGACAVSMQKIETDRLIRLPSGQTMTCSGCMLAKTAADVRNLCGSSCTP